jgi:imidazole glycerol-phosphate synthase subunit HisH
MNLDGGSCVVIDYKLGNIASVINMIRKVGGKATVASSKEEILSASKLILPGVGSFDHGIEQLHSLDFFSAIQEKSNSDTPLLGICLGMQLLANKSEEGNSQGLGLINAEFKRFSFESTDKFRIPHVGWNTIDIIKSNPLLCQDINQEQRFYFTHSYHAVCANEESILANTNYGHNFPCVYHNGNTYGVQFHPEKSHKFGMTIIKNFLDI